MQFTLDTNDMDGRGPFPRMWDEVLTHIHRHSPAATVRFPFIFFRTINPNAELPEGIVRLLNDVTGAREAGLHVYVRTTRVLRPFSGWDRIERDYDLDVGDRLVQS